MAGIANATSNIAAGNASLGDALAFLPVMTVGVQKLRGAPTNCFIAGTLVAVAGVGVGVGTADAGPSSASKPIEEIQVGDFVWARDEHDPSAPAKLEKVVALYRSTSYDLQQLEVVDALGQSEQIVATDGHPFYVVDVGWTTADAILVGQKLVGAGGAVLTVVANRDWKPDRGVVVYNFQVEGDHTYFVGDVHAQGEWVWTHNTCVYQAKGGDGKIIYVGITDSFKSRAAAHLREKSIQIDKIDGLTDLSRKDARAVEQLLIEVHKLGRNGGSLINKINSISAKSPNYTQARVRAIEILKLLGQVS